MSNFTSGLPTNIRLNNAASICPSCYHRKGRDVVTIGGREYLFCSHCRDEHEALS